MQHLAAVLNDLLEIGPTLSLQNVIILEILWEEDEFSPMRTSGSNLELREAILQDKCSVIPLDDRLL